jgi:hypothetical protein
MTGIADARSESWHFGQCQCTRRNTWLQALRVGRRTTGAGGDLSQIFGIEMAPATRSAAGAVPRKPPSSDVTVDGSTKQKVPPPGEVEEDCGCNKGPEVEGGG